MRCLWAPLDGAPRPCAQLQLQKPRPHERPHRGCQGGLRPVPTSTLRRFIPRHPDLRGRLPNDLHPDYLALCTALHDSIGTWIGETLTPADEIGGPRSALPEPEPSTPEHLVTITQQEVLDLITYIGPDMVVEQLDHGNQHLWIV